MSITWDQPHNHNLHITRNKVILISQGLFGHIVNAKYDPKFLYEPHDIEGTRPEGRPAKKRKDYLKESMSHHWKLMLMADAGRMARNMKMWVKQMVRQIEQPVPTVLVGDDLEKGVQDALFK